jgi:hypothetical protein
MKAKNSNFTGVFLGFLLLSYIIFFPIQIHVNSMVENPQEIWISDPYDWSLGFNYNITVEKMSSHFIINATDYKERMEVQVISHYEILNHNETSEYELLMEVDLINTQLSTPYIFDAGTGNLTSYIDDFWNIGLRTNVTFLGYLTTIVDIELNFIINVSRQTTSVGIGHLLQASSLWGTSIEKTIIIDVIGKQPSARGRCLNCIEPCNENPIEEPEVSEISGGNRYEWNITDEFAWDNYCKIYASFYPYSHSDLPTVAIILVYVILPLTGLVLISFIIFAITRHKKHKKATNN